MSLRLISPSRGRRGLRARRPTGATKMFPLDGITLRMGIPGQDGRDSGMISNRIRDEGEHRFRDEAEQFQDDPGIAFGFAGMISTN